jgi:TPR repeat protein
MSILTLALSVSSALSAADQPITDCDRLAAHPWDPQKSSEGVFWNMMRTEQAVEACNAAVGRDPSARNMYQYGRALAKSKQYEAAAFWYRRAGNLGYAQAQFAMGDAYEFGEGVPRNEVAAGDWYQRAVEQGHVHASAKLSRVLHASSTAVAHQVKRSNDAIAVNISGEL